MDISDRNFKPCPCGYQICQFCYHNIRQNPELNGRCPGCRRLYDDESVVYIKVSPEEIKLLQAKKEKRDREKKQREKERKETDMASKKHLSGLRVVQKNLVYVTGLNPPCNPEELHSLLRSDKYFGQYGKISKIVINRKNPPSNTGSSASTSNHNHHHHNNNNSNNNNQGSGLVVYVTFARKEDALNCITELDGSLCDGRILRAAHGTTKYCSSYLRGHPCPNPNCMFLHEPGEEADSYSRKDLSTQQGIKMGMTSRAHTTSFGEETYIPNHVLNGMSEEEVHQYQQPHSHAAISSSSLSTHHHQQQHQQQQQPHSQHFESKEHLPATAHWASSASATNSPTVNNNIPLANSAAFPTLAEIARDHKQQRKELKSRVSSSKVQKAAPATEDLSADDTFVLQFVEQLGEQLKNLDEIKTVKFKSSATGNKVPLFSFNCELCNETKPEDEKVIARQVIERFLLRPIKNYHLAYQNHPIVQQQSLLQRQQQQQQQQQQHTPIAAMAQIQHKTEEQQKQAQQQLLLLQLQQQQLQQQQQQQQQQNQNQNQINMLKTGRMNTSTPPPPGLFTTKVPGMQNDAMNAAVNPQSSSSQLLTQLMSGKK